MLNSYWRDWVVLKEQGCGCCCYKGLNQLVLTGLDNDAIGNSACCWWYRWQTEAIINKELNRRQMLRKIANTELLSVHSADNWGGGEGCRSSFFEEIFDRWLSNWEAQKRMKNVAEWNSRQCEWMKLVQEIRQTQIYTDCRKDNVGLCGRRKRNEIFLAAIFSEVCGMHQIRLSNLLLRFGYLSAVNVCPDCSNCTNTHCQRSHATGLFAWLAEQNVSECCVCSALISHRSVKKEKIISTQKAYWEKGKLRSCWCKKSFHVT